MRFLNDGFTKPKPMLKIQNSNFLKTAYLSLCNYSKWDNVFVTVQQKHIEEFAIDRFVLENIPAAEVIVLKERTNGPLESIVKALEITRKTCSFTVADCDQAFKAKFDVNLNGLISEKSYTACVPTFESSNPNYSYVVLLNGIIEAIAEKNPISKHAVAGAYSFFDFQRFNQSAQKILQDNDREPYISDVLQSLLVKGLDIKAIELEWNISFGTPAELTEAQIDPRLEIFLP
jgi:NDP-sugar pyrophosphorylase family protein